MLNAKTMALLLLALVLCPCLAAAENGSLAMLGVFVTAEPTQTTEAIQTPEPVESSPGLDLYAQAITQEEIEAAALGERILMRGMAGEDVALMQRRLWQLGYYLGEIDGVFGLGTRTAVYGFQRAHKLEKIDGKVGPESIACMFGDDVVIRPTPTPSPTPTPTPSPTPTATPKPTPAPSTTPDAENAPFEMMPMHVYIGGQKVPIMLGRDETGALLYPLCGVMEWLDYACTYAAGSWQLVRALDGAEIALMTDGQQGRCETAMGAFDGTLFLADETSRVYVYGEEAYVTDALLGQFGVSILAADGIPVIGE